MLSRIGKKILLWVILLVVIPLGLTSVIVYRQGRRIIEDQIKTILRVAADGIEAQTLYLLDSKKNRVHDFSSDGFLRERLKKINLRPGDTRLVNELNSHLSRSKKPVDRDILDIVVFDRQGKPVASTNEERRKGSKFEPEYFRNGLKGISIGTIEVRYAERHFTVSAPMTDASMGEFLGVITVLFKASAVDSILTGETSMLMAASTALGGLRERARINIYGKDNTIISSSRPELIGRHGDTEIVRRTISTGRETLGEYTGVLGDRRIGASMYLKEPGWAVVVSFSKDEVLAPLNSLAFKTIPFIFSGVIVVIALTIAFTRRITGSALRVTDAARRIAEGNFSERIRVEGGGDEFDELGAAFNGMAEKLRASFESLKDREERLARLNRFYSVLIKINEAIVRIRDEHKLYGEVCRIAVEEGLFKLAWVGLVDANARTVKPVMHCGRGDGYLERIRISTEDAPEGRGPTGTAVRRKRYDICNDIEHDPRMSPWRDEALRLGFRSSAAFPLVVGGRAIGAFNFYSGEPDYFEEDNIRLLERMTSDLSYAIEFIEKERLRQRSDEELHLLQGVSLSISGAEDFHSAIEVVLEKICASTGWLCAEAWFPGPDGAMLEYGTAWCAKGNAAERFIESCGGLKYEPGISLPGRVWLSGKPEWVEDVSVSHSTFLRTPAAIEAGLKAGLGVPIIAGDRVAAVLVFFMGEIREEDSRLIDLVTAVSAQLGSVVLRKLAEESLRESEHKYRTLVENLPQRIFLKDKGSNFVSCSENYARDLKIRPGEIRGKTDYDFQPKELAEKYRADDKKVMESGKAEEIEESYVHDGQESFVHTVKVPVKDESGNVTGVLGIFWDITEQKRAEAEKAKLEAQLRHMQKMEAIGQLTGGIAHDFNNLLTALIGNAYILENKIDKDSELISHVHQILAVSERAANLTRGLLAFSRKQIVEIKPVRLNDAIRAVERLLARTIGEDIELKTELTEEDISIMADRGQLEQVLINLATNARDAMPDGGWLTIATKAINVESNFVKTHGYGKPGRYALISVSDTGAGMDEATKERIFEPFFTTKELGRGTGLGLSIVYGIIKQHNGYINVYSEPGRGTAFTIYLPLIETGVEGAQFKDAAPPAGGTETVLLAEDEPEVRGFTKTLLEGAGYKVIEASDGEAAVGRFEENKENIRLLILDVVMPRKNGKEAYDEMARLSPGIKAIFTSGYNEEIIHRKGILAEGFNFISKPFMPADFLRKVRAVLDE